VLDVAAEGTGGAATGGYCRGGAGGSGGRDGGNAADGADSSGAGGTGGVATGGAGGATGGTDGPVISGGDGPCGPLLTISGVKR
jgi:hypothetical protein